MSDWTFTCGYCMKPLAVHGGSTSAIVWSEMHKVEIREFGPVVLECPAIAACSICGKPFVPAPGQVNGKVYIDVTNHNSPIRHADPHDCPAIEADELRAKQNT